MFDDWSIAMLLQDIISNPIVIAALINVSAVFLISLLSPVLQSKRDNQRWEREKLYDLHAETYESLTNLLKAVSASRSPVEISAAFYASTGALDRLRLAYAGEQSESISSIDEKLRGLYKGGLIQSYEVENLEEFRQKILAIAQSDSRLKNLFK